jgi:hypothetical protein
MTSAACSQNRVRATRFSVPHSKSAAPLAANVRFGSKAVAAEMGGGRTPTSLSQEPGTKELFPAAALLSIGQSVNRARPTGVYRE